MKNLSITLKVIIYVSILGFSSIFVMAYVSVTSADEILSNNASQQIETLQNIKKLDIEEFIKNKKRSLEAMIRMPATKVVINELDVKNIDNLNSSELLKMFNNPKYISNYNNYLKVAQNYMSAYNIKNVMLIEPKEGTIYFEANKDIKFHTKLSQGSSKLSSLWRSCLNTGGVLISDMETSENTNNSPSLYIGSRIIEKGEVVSVLIAEISAKTINDIVISSEGLGETGESYIVGDDLFFRSDSRFSTKSTTLNQKVKTAATEKVFAGMSGTAIINDYRGIKVLSSYDKLNIKGLNWAIITEVDESEIMAPKSKLINTIIIICIIIGIIMLPILLLIGRSLSNPLKREVAFAKKLANGELSATIDINQKDEIGEIADALREIADRTKQVITSVVNATNNLIDASFQLSSASQDISSGASEQASSVEEVSASMEEMASNIQQNADNAKQTEDITTGVSSQVESGSDIVLSSVASMEQIADKISIISDIAFQTNILALNASVEAARAGEYGKGFGVVATEVGKLADKTKSAAAEINEISKNSVEIAGKTKELMSELVPSIQNSSMLVQEISAASKEQRDAAEQINNAIQMLNDISQQNAASAEEMATNSEELSSQAEQLRSVISHFKIDGISNSKNRRNVSPQKLISKKNLEEFKNNPIESGKGIDIDLNTPDALDDEFERF